MKNLKNYANLCCWEFFFFFFFNICQFLVKICAFSNTPVFHGPVGCALSSNVACTDMFQNGKIGLKPVKNKVLKKHRFLCYFGSLL